MSKQPISNCVNWRFTCQIKKFALPWQTQSRRKYNRKFNSPIWFAAANQSTYTTHISNAWSSCIDLIFTSQTNLITDSGVHSSLYPICHHQIFFAKLNFHIVYPPPYLQEIWYYRVANTELIRRAIKKFNWERAFLNSSVMKKLIFLTELFLIF